METDEESNIKKLACDVIKIIPSLTWLIVCLVAIPAYVSVGWTRPVVCAVFSSVLSIWATVDFLFYLTPTINAYVPLLRNEYETRQTSLTKNFAMVKVGTALLFALLSLVWCISFLVVGYAYIRPEEDNQPCDGKCEGCVEDPNCNDWISGVENRYPATKICSCTHPC